MSDNEFQEWQCVRCRVWRNSMPAMVFKPGNTGTWPNLKMCVNCAARHGNVASEADLEAWDQAEMDRQCPEAYCILQRHDGDHCDYTGTSWNESGITHTYHDPITD